MTNQFTRGRGIVNIPFYEILMDSASYTMGAFMEIGVFKADTFQHIYRKADEYNRRVIAVDSFCGMPEPSHTGDGYYHKGKFDTGGSDWFKARFTDADVCEGFVPDIFPEIPELPYAFIHVDIDHFETSYAAIKWAWRKLSVNGIMVCHDYYEDRDIQAAGAITKWMNETAVTPIGDIDSSIAFRKFTGV